jgi:hypothetical protein
MFEPSPVSFSPFVSDVFTAYEQPRVRAGGGAIIDFGVTVGAGTNGSSSTTSATSADRVAIVPKPIITAGKGSSSFSSTLPSTVDIVVPTAKRARVVGSIE